MALTAAQATLVSQLNNAINRTSGGAVNAGEITVFTGSAAILAVPGSTTQNSTVNTILNVSSNTVGVIAGSGTTLNLNGVAGSFTLPINSSCQLTYVSSTSTWYVTLSTFPLTGDVTTVGAAATLVGTANVNTVVGALATVAAKAPLASPTFSGVATAPVFSASGITGATASSRYIGAWTGPGSPLSGTFSVGDWGVDEGSPTVWVCTTAGTIGAGCVFQNIAAVTTLTKALQLALTETTNYEPQNQLQGNTAVSLVQNQTNTHLPPVAAVAAGGAGVQGMFTNGTTWTVKFASSILGTLGNVGDTFQCYSEGFVPTGWNTGNAIAPVIATVTSSTTVTIPVTLANPGTVTTWGTVHNLGIQYTTFVTPTGISIPRAIVEAEGINTFAQSADGTLGVGPVFQNAMAYKNAASPYSGTFACVLSSNLYKVIGDVRASIPARAKLVGPGVPANAAISSVYYDGSNTVVGAYIQNTFTPANFTGSTGNQTLKVIPDIYSAEGFVNFPSIIADGGPVSYPLVGTTFAKPGQNQGWSNGYWCGSVFGVINGGTLSNVNIADYGAEAFLGVGTSALLRYGYYFDDTQTLQSSGTGGTLATQLGLAVGHLNPDLTWDTLYGATTNVGILNASTTFEPSQPPTTTVASLSGFDPTTIATVAVTATTTGTNTNITITAAGTWLTGQKVWLSGFSNGITAQQYTIGTGGLGSFVVPVTGTVTATGTGNVNGLIPVASTTGFPATGSLKIGCGGTNSTQLTIIAYTGIIGSFFIGCTFTSGAGGASISAGVSVLGAVNAQTLVTGFTLPVPLGAKMALTSTSAVSSATTQVITGTPAYDGQMLRLVNVGSNIITFNSGGTTGLSLSTAAYLLQPKGSLNLQWDAILGLWIQANGTGGVTTVARPVARVTTINPPGSTATYNTDTLDVLNLTGLNGACNLATNQTGTPAIGDQLVIHVTDNGTARTLSYGSKFESGPAVLPTTTQISVMLTMQFIWNDLTSKWRCVGSSAGATSTAAAATVTTPTFTSGTATQLANTSQDAMIYLDITLAGTLTVAIGPTSTPANTLYSSVAVSTATAFPSIRLPAGWYIKVTAVTATYTANVITC